MTQSELEALVSNIIEARLDAKQPTDRSWLVVEVMNQYPNIEGDDLGFYTLCANEHVGDTVRSALRRFAPSEKDDPRQQAFEGFQFLRRGYLVDRDGGQRLIPVDLLTFNELTAKADEYERFASGCQRHAREIRRYRDEKFSAVM